jgi:uncharacterized cofD-like protein
MPERRGKRIVCIGGGTGLATLLRGIKGFVGKVQDGKRYLDLDSLTAVVTMADDGGTTAHLIDQFGVLPPGDIRACLVALSEEEGLINQLFTHRIEGHGDLAGQIFGNLLLTALVQMNNGNLIAAIQDASRVLRAKGTILPATTEYVILAARLADGTYLKGESSLAPSPNRSPIAEVFFAQRNGNGAPEKYTPRALPEAVEAIRAADAIILGPGGLYTSIVPVLLISELADAISHTHAQRVFIANVMTQPGKTDSFSVADHIAELRKYGGFNIDHVLVNNRVISPEILARYKEEGQTQVLLSEEDADISARISFSGRGTMSLVEGAILHLADVIEEVPETSVNKDVAEISQKTVLRHNPAKLAAALEELLSSTQD